MTTPSGMNKESVVKGLELRVDTAILGLQTALPAGVTSVNVGTTSMPIADAIKLGQSAVQPFKDSREARATIRQISQNKRKNREACLAFLNDLKAGLIVVLGRESEVLTKFGFKPQRTTNAQLTVEEKARRVAKAAETRQKRNTMGSQQKAAIKATGTPDISIPATSDRMLVNGTAIGTPATASQPTQAPVASPTQVPPASR